MRKQISLTLTKEQQVFMKNVIDATNALNNGGAEGEELYLFGTDGEAVHFLKRNGMVMMEANQEANYSSVVCELGEWEVQRGKGNGEWGFADYAPIKKKRQIK